jgi:hypothetical protein
MAIKVDKKHPDLIALTTEENKLQALQSDRVREEKELARITELYLSRNNLTAKRCSSLKQSSC